MNKTVKYLLCSAAVLCFSLTAQATVIYDETIDGDAPSAAGGALVGATVNLVPGINDILGTTAGGFDDYIFTVPNGASITSIIFTPLTGFDFPELDDFAANLFTGDGTLLSSFSLAALIANLDNPVFGTAMPLSPGVYRIDHNLTPGESVDYRWRIVLAELDTDNDGVPDNEDECPSSDVSATVVIDGCNSGVPNTVSPSGCTISDLIAACGEGASNHGQFVSCGSDVTNDLKQAGTITGRQKGAIQSCAAQADIP
jgi:hypothetical protein